jgi:hypothetical protein
VLSVGLNHLFVRILHLATVFECLRIRHFWKKIDYFTSLELIPVVCSYYKLIEPRKQPHSFPIAVMRILKIPMKRNNQFSFYLEKWIMTHIIEMQQPGRFGRLDRKDAQFCTSFTVLRRMQSIFFRLKFSTCHQASNLYIEILTVSDVNLICNISI